jgi:uncharacterized protein (UPF0548 family)
MFSLLYDLILRAIIIVAVTDAIIFYLISINSVRVMGFGYGTLLGHCCYIGAAHHQHLLRLVEIRCA